MNEFIKNILEVLGIAKIAKKQEEKKTDELVRENFVDFAGKKPSSHFEKERDSKSEKVEKYLKSDDEELKGEDYVKAEADSETKIKKVKIGIGKEAVDESSQDYNRKFFDEILKQLNAAGIKDATYEYQEEYIKVPGVDTFRIKDVLYSGKVREKDLKEPYTKVELIDPEGNDTGATRGDLFMKKPSDVLEGYVLILHKQDGTIQTIEDPKVSDVPDITEIMDTIQYEPGTLTEIVIFYPESDPDVEITVTRYKNEVNAFELVDYCKNKIKQKGRGLTKFAQDIEDGILVKTAISRDGWQIIENAVDDVVANFKKITGVDPVDTIDSEGSFKQDVIVDTIEPIKTYVMDKYFDNNGILFEEFLYKLDDALLDKFAEEVIAKHKTKPEDLSEERESLTKTAQKNSKYTFDKYENELPEPFKTSLERLNKEVFLRSENPKKVNTKFSEGKIVEVGTNYIVVEFKDGKQYLIYSDEYEDWDINLKQVENNEEMIGVKKDKESKLTKTAVDPKIDKVKDLTEEVKNKPIVNKKEVGDKPITPDVKRVSPTLSFGKDFPGFSDDQIKAIYWIVDEFKNREEAWTTIINQAQEKFDNIVTDEVVQKAKELIDKNIQSMTSRLNATKIAKRKRYRYLDDAEIDEVTEYLIDNYENQSDSGYDFTEAQIEDALQRNGFEGTDEEIELIQNRLEVMSTKVAELEKCAQCGPKPEAPPPEGKKYVCNKTTKNWEIVDIDEPTTTETIEVKSKIDSEAKKEKEAKEENNDSPWLLVNDGKGKQVFIRKN